jgi:glycosyltransferase involved in cell wall biosynthesis
MRILFMTQYYPPETGAPQNRLSDLARYLSQFGHTVTVLTALPNYPKGEVFEGYRGRLAMIEQVGSVRIIRTWLYAALQKDFARRLMNYFSFMLSSVLFGVGKIGKQDVVVVESPPLFLGLSGYFLSRLRSAKLVLNISDLWPESAVAMGVLRNRVLIRLSQHLEEFLYRRADLITGQTQGIVENIGSRCPMKRVAFLPNGVDAEAFIVEHHGERTLGVRKEFDVEGKFVVGYAGLHGLAQGLETVLSAAQILSAYEGITFLLVGEGVEKPGLVRLAAELGLTNTRFCPGQPAERIPEVLAVFDVALVPLKRLDLFKGAVPSKMFEAMAAGVPLILSVEGEARSLLEAAQAGIYVEPENPQGLAEGILHLYRDPGYRKQLGRNGRKYVVEHRDRRRIAKTFEELLLENL